MARIRSIRALCSTGLEKLQDILVEGSHPVRYMVYSYQQI